ncbi:MULTISPECIES: hypothetical protein [unclassified Acidovorax]|uniref:hypothetical protein n=1 Tax=unclassified Acidovorax TaxID=2684926 RepID=UPI0028835427|nr:MULTISPECIES: hypothetical protein [unclassified Acidovorax]
MASKKKRGNRPNQHGASGPADALKNRVRGAVAAFKKVPVGQNAERRWASEQRAVGALNRALNDARRKLHLGALRAFEAWADVFIKAQLQAQAIGTSPALLGVLPTKPASVTLASALNSAHGELLRARVPLNRYAKAASAVASTINSAKWAEAAEQVRQIAAEFGHSYWSIETEIALQHSLGLADSVKTKIQQYSAGAAGLNRFYFYHFGLRGESSQSSTRFRALVVKRLSDSKLEKLLRAYALYRATGTPPESADEMAAALSFDQLTTRIDLLHTAVKVAASVLSTERRQLPEVIASAKAILRDFRDPLVTCLFDECDGNFTLRVPPPLEAGLRDATRNVLADNPLGAGVVARGIASLLTFNGSEADEEQFRKYLLNFNWLPEAIYLTLRPQISKVSEILKSVRLEKAQLHQPLDEQLRQNITELLASGRINQPYLQRLATAPGVEPSRLLVHGRPIWDMEVISPLAVECLAIDGARSALDEGDESIAVAISANAPLENSRLAAGLPLADLFGGRGWKRVATFGPSVELCCSLHQYLGVHDERQIRTFKRFAIEDLMRHRGAKSLLDLCSELAANHPNQNLVSYFLSNVCDLPTLELLPGIDGSRQALKARSLVLRIAAQLTEQSSAQLISEAEIIDSELEVDSALDVLDDSKVYVDEEPLLRLASKELAPDFERYKQLVAAGVGEATSLEELLRNVRQQSGTIFQIPKNEAEDLLLQIMEALRAKFVDDPVNGLDSVIGRRIRHGTISGELRGTLEQFALIGQRPRTGADYDAPDFAVKLGAELEPRVRKAINSAFARFSLAIDSLVAQLRDEVFRCAPSGKLKPAFELKINPFAVAVARSMASQCETVSQFARECFEIFWFALSSTVERDRPTVDDFIKRSLREIFAKLSHDLKNIGVTDPTALAKVQQASDQLQYNASLIASWIRVPRLNQEGRTYPLPLVFDVALALVKSKRSGFEPKITSKVDGSVQLDAHGFPFVHDALQIALDNIAEHSGIKAGNFVDVAIELVENRKLVFEIRSDIAREAWTKERVQRFEQINLDISRKNYERARKDKGGSGLTRLAGLVHQHADAHFSAVVTSNSNDMLRFSLEFELIYIPLEATPSASHDLEEVS